MPLSAKITTKVAEYKNPDRSNYARIHNPENKKRRYNSNRSNKLVVPGAREAMDKFKMEAANDLRVSVPS